MRRRSIGCVLGLCSGLVFASIASAEVPKELKGQVTKLRGQITAVQSKLNSSRIDAPDSPAATRALAFADERLAKADELTQGLPATETEVAELLQKLAETKAEVAKRRSAGSAASAKAADDSKALEVGLAEDLSTLEALSEKMIALRDFAGDNDKVEGLSEYARVEEDAKRLVAKYEGKTAQSADAKRMVAEVRSLSSELRSLRSRFADFHSKFLPTKIAQYLKEAEEGTTPGRERSNIDLFMVALTYAERSRAFLDKFEILAPSFPETDRAFVPSARARVNAVLARIASAKETVATRNKPPTDAYTGKDKDALIGHVRDGWKVINRDQHSPVAIVIPGTGWVRHTSWQWSNDRWRKVDVSTLETFVFYKASDTTAFGWGVYLVKDHMAGDALRVKSDPARDTPANWSQVYLLSKIPNSKP